MVLKRSRKLQMAPAWVYGLFVPKMFRSRFALDDSFPGSFDPWTFCSLDLSFHGQLKV